jgi:hypothetical protein
MTLTQDIGDYETVRQWARGLEEQWGETPEMGQRHATLQAFASFSGKDPDTMITDCTREVDSGKRIRIKARREYSAKIEEFQATIEGNSRQQAKAANYVRSFFIHNGIFMQAGVSA